MLRKGHDGLYKAPKIEERRRRKAKRRGIRSNLFILDVKGGRLQDLGKQKEGKTFYKLHILFFMHMILPRCQR